MTSSRLTQLLRALKELRYTFHTVTPDTHAFVNARPENALAASVPDVLGWNRPFRPEILPPGLFELLRDAGGCESLGEGLWRPTLRVSSLNEELFLHSAFPTSEAGAVFFGPDSYRFVHAVLAAARPARRAVEVCAGTGVGGIALARRGLLETPVLLGDINPKALEACAVNAEAAEVRAEPIESDLLRGIDSRLELDLVIANPPYLRDSSSRTYRHGGGHFGERLSLRLVDEALTRLGQNRDGGTLLLYTGSAVVRGVDTFWVAAQPLLRERGAVYTYQELDPDVFGSELAEPAYAEVERIAAVFLEARMEGRGRRP